MKIKKKSRFLIGAFFATAIFVSCASSPEVPTNTFDDDIALILRNFVPYEGFDDLPESCKLADGQAPRVIPSTGKAVASMRELQQKLQQIEDQNFYRAVGEMRGSQRDSIKYNSVRKVLRTTLWRRAKNSKLGWLFGKSQKRTKKQNITREHTPQGIILETFGFLDEAHQAIQPHRTIENGWRIF